MEAAREQVKKVEAGAAAEAQARAGAEAAREEAERARRQAELAASTAAALAEAERQKRAEAQGLRWGGCLPPCCLLSGQHIQRCGWFLPNAGAGAPAFEDAARI